jgi:hypothetical protein
MLAAGKLAIVRLLTTRATINAADKDNWLDFFPSLYHFSPKQHKETLFGTMRTQS